MIAISTAIIRYDASTIWDVDDKYSAKNTSIDNVTRKTHLKHYHSQYHMEDLKNDLGYTQFLLSLFDINKKERKKLLVFVY